MKLSVISFTAGGAALSAAVREALEQEAEVTVYTKHKSSESGEDDFRETGRSEKADSTRASGGIEKADSTKEYDRFGKADSTKGHGKLGKISNITENCNQWAEYVRDTLSAWTGAQFHSQNALLFIGASGIAVRAIAPYVKDKLEDPAVLVMDEAGRFVIPLLSGHYGGANELAEKLAERLGATAVLTTATDVNGLFAVDVFARKNNLIICNRNGIKAVSSAVLAGERVTMAIAGDHQEKLPVELTRVLYPPADRVSVVVSPYRKDAGRAELQLCPRAYYIGIGCRRGKLLSEIEDAVEKQLQKAGIRREALAALASIDLKMREPGLLQLAEKYHLPFQTYSQEELKRIPGEFTASFFVQEQVGVDNVCERAALAASGEGGRLLIRKYAENGITVAMAVRKWSVTFDEA